LKHEDYYYYYYGTTQRRSRLQRGYCIGVSRWSAQATADKGLAQGPYKEATAGVEPTTLWLKVIVSAKAPPCPTLFFQDISLSARTLAFQGNFIHNFLDQSWRHYIMFY